MISILLITQNPEIQSVVSICLHRLSPPLQLKALPYSQAAEALEGGRFPIVIWDVDRAFPSPHQMVKKWKEIYPFLILLLIVEKADIAEVSACLQFGACDFFLKPFEDLDSFLSALEEAKKKVERWREALPL